MPENKKLMLQSRLHKRLQALNLLNFNEYVDYLFDNKINKEELIHLIDVVSTNKTDFFREPHHFTFIRNHLQSIDHKSHYPRGLIKAWSAGCSSGEEPYSLSITMSEALENKYGMDYSILGTDISNGILENALDAIYKEEDIINIPADLRKKYFLRSKDKSKKLVRLIPEIRKRNKFFRLNLMDNTYPLQDTFDMIFCRNVLIYFERETQEKVINKLCQKLKKGGYFFLGHSESIVNMDVPLKQIKATIFQRV
jgi:chemotaxis protein methyltransferase CheR